MCGCYWILTPGNKVMDRMIWTNGSTSSNSLCKEWKILSTWGWCSFKPFSYPGPFSPVVFESWIMIMNYKHVRVEAPAGSTQQLIGPTEKTHRICSPLLTPLLLSGLFCSDSSIYRHVFSQLGMKLFFTHLYQPQLTVEVSDFILFSTLQLHPFQAWELAMV